MAKWTLRKLRVDAITHGSGPDSYGDLRDRLGNEPIYVTKSLWCGYKVYTGNSRLSYARLRGDTHIMAYVRS